MFLILKKLLLFKTSMNFQHVARSCVIQEETRGIIIAYFRNSAILVEGRVNKQRKFDVVLIQSKDI